MFVFTCWRILRNSTPFLFAHFLRCIFALFEAQLYIYTYPPMCYYFAAATSKLLDPALCDSIYRELCRDLSNFFIQADVPKCPTWRLEPRAKKFA